MKLSNLKYQIFFSIIIDVNTEWLGSYYYHANFKFKAIYSHI